VVLEKPIQNISDTNDLVEKLHPEECSEEQHPNRWTIYITGIFKLN
jgi:hypothetical protein